MVVNVYVGITNRFAKFFSSFFHFLLGHVYGFAMVRVFDKRDIITFATRKRTRLT